MLVQLVGNVVRDATVRTVNNNKQVINFAIALNYKYQNAAGELINLPTFIDCEHWKDSEVHRDITKGKQIIVFGRLFPHGYKNKSGDIKGVIKCNVSDIYLGTAKNSDQSTHEPDNDTPSNEDEAEPVNILAPEDDLPF